MSKHFVQIVNVADASFYAHGQQQEQHHYCQHG